MERGARKKVLKGCWSMCQNVSAIWNIFFGFWVLLVIVWHGNDSATLEAHNLTSTSSLIYIQRLYTCKCDCSFKKKVSMCKDEKYRPISMTPKKKGWILEKFIRHKIIQHCESVNLLTEFQHWFKRGYSFVTELLECFEDWSDAIDSGEVMDDCLFDLQSSIWQISTQTTAYWTLRLWWKRHCVLLNRKFSVKIEKRE